MILTDELSLSKLPAEYVDILDSLKLGRDPSVQGAQKQLCWPHFQMRDTKSTFQYCHSKAQLCLPLEIDPSLCSLGDGDPFLAD